MSTIHLNPTAVRADRRTKNQCLPHLAQTLSLIFSFLHWPMPNKLPREKNEGGSEWAGGAAYEPLRWHAHSPEIECAAIERPCDSALSGLRPSPVTNGSVRAQAVSKWRLFRRLLPEVRCVNHDDGSGESCDLGVFFPEPARRPRRQIQPRMCPRVVLEAVNADEQRQRPQI
jgi:hypothetical protein